MDIMLINPRYDETQYRYRVNKLCPPLGMAYIAAVLLQDGHVVRILDMEAEGMEWDDLRSFLKRESPRLVGVSGTTPISKYTALCVKVVREALPDATIVVGGPHATLLPEEALEKMPQLDYLLRGEAEHTMKQLAALLDAGSTASEIESIPGIAFRNGGEVFISDEIPRVEDLNGLPRPAYDLLPLDRYFSSGVSGRVFTIMTSRGCPYGCIFCSVSGLYGRKFRGRSHESVADEIEFLKKTHGVDHILFYDASFNIDRKRVEAICRTLIERSLDITWRARMRADNLDRDLLELMKRAGCNEISIGVESGSQEILDGAGKSCKLQRFESIFKTADELDIWTSAYFMLGLPGETRETALKTIEYAKRLDPDWALFSVATPLPGTKFLEMVRENLTSKDWSDYKYNTITPVISYENLTDKDIGELMEYAYRSFYVREEWVKTRLRKARTPAQADNIISTLFAYLPSR